MSHTKPISPRSVLNTFNNDRLVDGGRSEHWATARAEEPDWTLFDGPYGRLEAFAAELDCQLPPIDHCWLYQVWRGAGWATAGWRSDRYHLTFRLAFGYWIPDGAVPNHLCHEARSGCINPFHISVGTEQADQRDKPGWICRDRPLLEAIERISREPTQEETA